MSSLQDGRWLEKSKPRWRKTEILMKVIRIFGSERNDTSANRVILVSIQERGGNTFLGDQDGATSVPSRLEESEE